MAKAFVYKCIGPKDFKVAYKARPLIKGNVDKVPRNLPVTKKKVVPPKLSPTEMKRMAALVADASVNLIAFPVFLAECTKKCNNGLDLKKHLIVLILNKQTHSVEVFDDMLPSTMKLVGMNPLLNNGLAEFLLPKLRTLFPVDDPAPLTLVLPSFKERYYKTFIDALAEGGHSADNFSAHAAFIANYLEVRVADPAASHTKIHARIIKLLATHDTRRDFLTAYDRLRTTKLRPSPCDDDKMLNHETLKCVMKDGDVGKRILGVKHTGKTGERGPSVNIHEYFIPADARKHGSRLDAMEIGGQTSLVNAYLRSKYSDIAYIAKYTFKWNGSKNTLQTRTFKTTWDEAMAYNARYVVFNLELLHGDVIETHANALIYDKEKRELERFEPHGHGYVMFEQSKLDEAISAFFGDRIGTYLPPLLTCPIGLQDDDDDEINPGAKDIGGNCAVWTLYYMDVRLSNPLMPRAEVVKAAIDGIKRRGSFRMFINAYHWHVQRAFRLLRRKK